MTISPERVIRVKCQAILDELQADNSRTESAGVVIVEQYNEMRAQVAELLPELKPHLPKQLSSDGPMREMGYSSIPKVDLKVCVRELISLVDEVTR